MRRSAPYWNPLTCPLGRHYNRGAHIVTVLAFALGLGIGGAAWFITYQRYQTRLQAERDHKAAAYQAVKQLLNDLDAHEAKLSVQDRIIEKGLVMTAPPVTKQQDVVDNRAERVRELHAEGMSMVSIQEIVFGFTGGGAYRFVRKVLSTPEVE